MSTCAVKWCGKNSRTSSIQKDGITFHRFPKCPERKSKWIDATFRGERWFPSTVICSRHFTEDSFHLMKNRRRLMDTALPKLYLPVLDSSTTNTDDSLATEKPVITESEAISSKPIPSSSSSQEAVESITSKTQAVCLETPKRKRKIQSLPDTPSAYDSPTKKRLCRKIIELQNTMQSKNKIIKKVRDSNRRLKRRLKTLESLLTELEKKNLITAENRDILNSVGVKCSEIIKRQMLRGKSGTIV